MNMEKKIDMSVDALSKLIIGIVKNATIAAFEDIEHMEDRRNEHRADQRSAAQAFQEKLAAQGLHGMVLTEEELEQMLGQFPDDIGDVIANGKVEDEDATPKRTSSWQPDIRPNVAEVPDSDFVPGTSERYDED